MLKYSTNNQYSIALFVYFCHLINETNVFVQVKLNNDCLCMLALSLIHLKDKKLLIDVLMPPISNQAHVIIHANINSN
jgi:hypothetical protein